MKATHTSKSDIHCRWAIPIICLAAFAAITVVSAGIYEHVPHSEDEVAYLFQAKVFAQNRLSVPTPPYSEAFWTPFVLDYQGQRFGKYPIGWPLLLSFGVRIDAPWLINASLATLTLGLIAWLGRLFYAQLNTGGYIPALAAGLGLVTPGYLFLSSSLLSHTASLFWATVALAALFYAVQTNNTYRPAAGIILGAALGATFITRPFAALGIGAAIGVFLIILIWRDELGWATIPWVVAGGLPVAALLPLYWWAVAGDPTFNPYLLVWPYDRVGFGPDVGPLGYTWRDAIFINTRLKVTTLATGLFGWPGWSNLLFLPVPFVARQATRWDWLLLGVIAGLIAAHIFYWAFGGVDGGFPRYYYDALPAFLLLTARGIQICADVLKRWSKTWVLLSLGGNTIKMNWLLGSLILMFIFYNLGWTLPSLLSAQKGKYNITPAPLQIVEEANVPEPALILISDYQTWSDFAAPFSANSPTLDGPTVYAIDWTPALTEQLRSYFSGRSCWQLAGERLSPCPALE